MATNIKVNNKYANIDKTLVYFSCFILLVLSLMLYKQRIIFADTAAYVSHMLSRDEFQIAMHSRFVGAIPQLLPYLAFKAHFSLNNILIIYSLSFILIPVVCILVSVRWFKETQTAWSILLFYTLMSISMFYYPVSEYQIGLCLFLFYIGLFEHYSKPGSGKITFTILSLLFIPTVIFSHPLSSIVFLCWLVLQFSLDWKNRKILLFISILGALSFTVKKLFFGIQYETDKTTGLENFRHFSVWDLYQKLGKAFVNNLINDYFLLVVLAAVSIIFFIAQKKYKTAFLLPAALAAWCVLVTVSFKDEHYDHYYEHMYQAIPFFIAWAFCRLTVKNLNPLTAISVLSFVMIVSLAKIYKGRNSLDQRMLWMSRCFTMMDEMKCKKAIFTISHIPNGSDYPAHWSIPYESLLLSSLKNPDSSKVILMKHDLESAKSVHDEVWDIDNIEGTKKVPKEYFNIANQEYCIPELQTEAQKINQLTQGIIP